MFLLIGKSRMKIRRHTYIALEKGGRLVKVGEVLDDFPVKRTGHVMKNQMKCCHSWRLTYVFGGGRKKAVENTSRWHVSYSSAPHK